MTICARADAFRPRADDALRQNISNATMLPQPSNHSLGSVARVRGLHAQT